MTMIRQSLYALLLLHVGIMVASCRFQAALDEIVAFHRQDTAALSRTLDSLSTIASRLQSEPDNPKYRNIRLLNKTFWERVGSVNGGIAFMSSLGFDLLGQGADDGPCFQTRSGTPAEADLRQALDLLSARRVQLGEHEKANQHPKAPSAASRSDFNPFATAFSRKSRTHLQERAEHGLAHLCQSQARQQQRFSNLEERNITILLPREQLQQPQETSASSDREIAKPEGSKDFEKDRELELVAHLWRERMAHDEVERFETSATKKLRLLRSAKVYPYVVLRVRLPGGLFLQGRFNPDESWETVYQVVGESLSVEAGYGTSDHRLCHNFELFMAPPVRVFPRDSTSLKNSNAQAPACVLHLRWESENASAISWAQKLEERMSQAMGGSVHPRVPYSSRYDVPEAISSKRPQDPVRTEEGGAAGFE